MRFSPSNGSSAAGKKEGDVGILLGFCDAQLTLVVVLQILAQRVVQILRRESAGQWNIVSVSGEGDEACGSCKGASFESGEVVLHSWCG